MDDFVLVPVPKSRVLDVYEFLSRTGTAQPEPGTGGDAAPDTAWPVETLQRSYRESSPAMRQFLDYLADRAGMPVSSSELGSVIGYSAHQMAGMLGAAGRRMENRHHRSLPVAKEWRSAESAFYYVMDHETAAVIIGLRSTV